MHKNNELNGEIQLNGLPILDNLENINPVNPGEKERNDKKLLEDVNSLLEGIDEEELKKIHSQLSKVPSIEIAESYLSKNYNIIMNTISNKMEYKRIVEKNFTELNADELYREFQKRKIKFNLSNIKSLLKSDFVKKYNPVEDYFAKLPKWDGRDYIEELSGYVQAKEQKMFAYHFKKHLVRSVACALSKDFINKQCFVLVGGQNNGKSTYCRFMTPKKLMAYHTENIGMDKDSLIALCENFTINLDELSSFSKTEINSLKAIFSLEKVKVRRPYAENTSQSKRIANFWGSTNKDEFLSDETGSVRWLCFEVGAIDFKYRVDCDIDKVYSQAYSLYQSGFDYQLSKEDILSNDERNKRFQIYTPEMQALIEKYKPLQKNDYDRFNDKHQALSTTQLTQELAREYPYLRFNSQSVGKGLTFFKFEKKSMRKGDGIPGIYWILEDVGGEKLKEN